MIPINSKKMPITANAGRPAKYPFSNMKVNDSFTIKAKNYSALTSAKNWAERNNKTWKFKGSMSGGSLTIWRIK